MLYNPDLYKEPSLADCANFAASRDPQERYDWGLASRCACAQYSHTKGMKEDAWRYDPNNPHVWNRLNQLADGAHHKHDWTFGKFHDRIREQLELV